MTDRYMKIMEYWNDNLPSNIGELDVLIRNKMINFSYNSNKIENNELNYYETREIFENGKIMNFSGDPKDLFEVQNHKICYKYLLNKIIIKEPITVEFIKEIHDILTSGTYDEKRFIDNNERSGQFKKHDYITGKHEVGYNAEDVEDGICDLVDDMNDKSINIDILKKASYFHAQFEHIHPFADGNGRTGRMLLNYFLMINDHPPLTFYVEDKIDYYKALEMYDLHDDIDTLENYLLNQLEKTWNQPINILKKTSLKERLTSGEVNNSDHQNKL